MKNNNTIYIGDTVAVINHPLKNLIGKNATVVSIVYYDTPLFNVMFEDGSKQTVAFYNLKKVHIGTVPSGTGIVSEVKIIEVKNKNLVFSTSEIKETDKDIIIFFHICCIGNYEEVVTEIVSCIIDNGLYNKCKKIYYSDIGGVMSNDIINYLNTYNKFELIYKSNEKKDAEYPTLIKLQNSCIKTEKEVYILYLHTKGVSMPDNKTKQSWRKRLLQKTVREWKECVTLLINGCDIAGCGWKDKNDVHTDHFSGNFWWASSFYIKKLPSLEKILDESKKYMEFEYTKYRVQCEAFIGMNDNKKVGINGELNQNYSHSNFFDEKIGLYRNVQETQVKKEVSIPSVIKLNSKSENKDIVYATENFQLTQHEKEITGLINFLKDKNINSFAEVGSYKGGTFYMLAKLCKGKKIMVDWAIVSLGLVKTRE